MNDSIVRHVDTKAVMNKQAYVLFYIRSPELNAPPAESYCPLEHVKATSWSCLKRPHSAKEDPGPSYRTAALLTGAQETQDVGPPQREQLPEPLQVRRQEQQQQQLPATPDTQQPLPLVPEQPPPPPRSHSSRCHSTSNHRQSCSSHHHHRRRSHRSRRQHHSSCCHRVSHSSQSNSSQSNSSHQSHHSHRHSGRTAATTGVTTGTRPTKISRWLKSMITCLTSCFPSRSN
ncbi:pair-rule protein odd-paired-like [Lethenteron reissneri]|uniref:pair-rule protein odd-paired-like n=1 Tax=Lethenteron reissneri TaxID=7753 RepID=UPI002AB6E226|nr:pair-rule protein odd-paired-like [Lethenteron reissneri]